MRSRREYRFAFLGYCGEDVESMEVRCSVFIPSYRRPQQLTRCLHGLSGQTRSPGEVIVVWQGDDEATRDAALAEGSSLSFPLHVLHSAARGVVPAENAALAVARGDVILLIDDDAVAPPDWVERHLRHYDDPSVGAVGGPADNFTPDGKLFPRRQAEPVGKVSWAGRLLGNMYDHPPAWRSRPPQPVDHLVGYNLSLRRAAFDRFDGALRSYWQLFELDACFQVTARGFRVLFDFGIVVEHHPTNTAFTQGRHGDLDVKVFNPAFNHAYVLAKHFSGVRRVMALLRLLVIGTTNAPGLAGYPLAVRRFGSPLRELKLLRGVIRSAIAGFWAGSRMK